MNSSSYSQNCSDQAPFIRVGDSPKGIKLVRAAAQQVAESIVGPVEWDGAEGKCRCPGEHLHTNPTGGDDCDVVCERVELSDGVLAPGVYCFHNSCGAASDNASHALRSALGKATQDIYSPTPVRRPGPAPLKAPDPLFDPGKLESIAKKVSGVDMDWVSARSKKPVGKMTPATFLHELYRPSERVVVFDVFQSQGQFVWTHEGSTIDENALDSFRAEKRCGVWFLCNPVTGEYAENHRGKQTRRSRQNVTAWRYLVLESDEAKPEHWLAALAQMPLPISAIYTSGGKSIHALVRIDAESKSDWDSQATVLKPALIKLGADGKAITAVRLTRLPCCLRLGTEDKTGAYIPFPEPRLQQLIYLNGAPDGTPICEQKLA